MWPSLARIGLNLPTQSTDLNKCDGSVPRITQVRHLNMIKTEQGNQKQIPSIDSNQNDQKQTNAE